LTDGERRRPRLVGVIVLALIALVGLGVIASLSLDEGDTDPIEIEGSGEVQELLGGIRQLDARLGHPDAAVTVQVFNDLQCTDCVAFQLDTIDPLIRDEVRSGDVKLVYHHYSMTERATGLASFGAVAAAQQDDEWQFIELFFRNQDEAAEHGGATREFLDRVAAGILEFNVEQWQRDFEDAEVQQTLDEDNILAAELKLPTEPAVVVSGPSGSRTLIETPTLDQIREAIEAVN
jgi:protein-disulfide isomerase